MLLLARFGLFRDGGRSGSSRAGGCQGPWSVWCFVVRDKGKVGKREVTCMAGACHHLSRACELIRL